jgi:adenylate cyclase class IV
MSFSYEIEIKVLLTTLENMQHLKSVLASKYPNIVLKSKNSQLNHYFIGGNFPLFLENLSHILPAPKFESLESIMNHEWIFSFRTRFVDGNSILVIKLSLGVDSSSNGVSRLEWEYTFINLPIEWLDELLLKSWFEYQAKWSRQREELILPNDMIVCIDKNAGYGYLAEFEKVIEDKEKVEQTKKEILWFIEELWFQELSQERLERMFAFYNKNWRDYYGTEKYFIID